MSNRYFSIRAAGILIDGCDRVLLVLEYTKDRLEIWVPPGGGVELTDESVVDCVCREFKEETGLTVEVGQLAYVREGVTFPGNAYHLELYFLVRVATNQDKNLGQSIDEQLIRPAQWFTRAQLQTIRVNLTELRDKFWEEYKKGWTGAKYLDTLLIEE